MRDGKITIDGKEIEITAEDKNIVDVASREGIAIPAPCYRAKRKNGCCHGCVVDVDGNQEYACATKPVSGMDIIVDRADLKELRSERLKKYSENMKSGNYTSCSCSGGKC